MKRKIILSFLIIAATLVFSLNAGAITVTFDPTGSGGGGSDFDFDKLDFGPSSAAAIGGNPTTPGALFNLYTHATLSSFINASGNPVAGTGLSSAYELTVVMGFEEKVTSSIPGTFAVFTATGATGLGKVNFFELYLHTTINADQELNDGSAGSGFDDGVKIMSGEIVGGKGGFVVTGGSSTALLDQFNSSPLPIDEASGAVFGTNPTALALGTTQDTIIGSGSTDLDAQVKIKDIDTDYFVGFDPSIMPGYLLTIALSTRNSLPFTQVDPSNIFTSSPDAGSTLSPTIGFVNGAPPIPHASGIWFGGGPDIMFETDASVTFDQALIPEPASMLLMGFGLLGLAGFGRRKSWKSKS